MGDVFPTIEKFLRREPTPREKELVRLVQDEFKLHDEDVMWAFIGMMFWASAVLRADAKSVRESFRAVEVQYVEYAREAANRAETAGERIREDVDSVQAQADRVEAVVARFEERAAAQDRAGWTVKVGFAVALVAVVWLGAYGAVWMYDAGRSSVIETVRANSPGLASSLFGSRSR